MPRLNQIEGLADPKAVIFDLLRDASERKGRKLQGFDVEKARTLVSQYIADFALLRLYRPFKHLKRSFMQLQNHHLDRWI